MKDVTEFWDLSIPLRFGGEQPNAYGVERANSEPVRAGSLVGDTRLGGSVNFEQYTFIPHCNGTHTECVGHLTHARISIRNCLKDVFMEAALISVEPETDREGGDLLITREAIAKCVAAADAGATDALIIRTRPNDESKLTRQYGTEADGAMRIPPYFTTDAIRSIVARGVRHLLCDLPSIDRIYDEGKLINHRIFWNVEEGSFEVNAETRINCTITELIYVPDHIADGRYMLNLQIAPFDSDCAPSRPILMRNE
ncbi:MAG: cyclase family protein [Blastocatellia bacterium]|nr:cyclase family protein [Blastocatellia bacterium]